MQQATVHPTLFDVGPPLPNRPRTISAIAADDAHFLFLRGRWVEGMSQREARQLVTIIKFQELANRP